MKAFDQTPRDDESIEALAAAWLAQRDDGFTPEKEAEFALWRRADPRHEAAVLRLEATWNSLQVLRHFRPEGRVHPDPDLLTPVRPRRPFLVSFLVWSAAAALALVAGAWLYRRAHSGERTRFYSTTPGGYQRITLADGSVAKLNTDSEIGVHYTPGDRQVRLIRGEAHFTVAKNKERPFLVKAGSVVVRAVGTAFDVRKEDLQVDVLVTEGKVALAENGDHNQPAGALQPAWPSLRAGQQAIISLTGSAIPIIENVTPAAIRDLLAWQDDRLTFVSTPLAKVVDEFNRRNQVQIELGDPALGALPISGSFRPENVEAFVRLLAQGGDISVEQPEPGRFVLRAAH